MQLVTMALASAGLLASSVGLTKTQQSRVRHGNPLWISTKAMLIGSIGAVGVAGLLSSLLGLLVLGYEKRDCVAVDFADRMTVLLGGSKHGDDD